MLTDEQKEDLFLWVVQKGAHQFDLEAEILDLETERFYFDAYDCRSIFFKDGFPFAARDEMTFDSWVIKNQK